MTLHLTPSTSEVRPLLPGTVVVQSAIAAGGMVVVVDEDRDDEGDLMLSASSVTPAQVAIAAEGCGVVVYLRGYDGRGIGLAHKIRAHALQGQGLDTVDADTTQGLPVDSRSHGTGAQILAIMGARRLRLITDSPSKYTGLSGHGLTIVDRVALPSAENPHNLRYLRTKQERLGHRLGVTDHPRRAPHAGY